MDQVKIGKFIAQRRKQQGMSQKQLAEQLGMTDKTVSKWETGYRMPDASVLLKLSRILQVDVNELLAGEKFPAGFPSEEYVQRSQSNLVHLVGELHESDKKRKSGRIGAAVGSLLVALSFFALLRTSLRMGEVTDILDLPTLFYLLGVKFFVLSVTGWFRDYANAWRACLLHKKLPETKIHAAMQAVKYAGALSLALGCVTSALGAFSLFNYMGSKEPAWQDLAQAVLPFFYTALQETGYVILYFGIKRIGKGL